MPTSCSHPRASGRETPDCFFATAHGPGPMPRGNQHRRHAVGPDGRRGRERRSKAVSLTEGPIRPKKARTSLRRANGSPDGIPRQEIEDLSPYHARPRPNPCRHEIGEPATLQAQRKAHSCNAKGRPTQRYRRHDPVTASPRTSHDAQEKDARTCPGEAENRILETGSRLNNTPRAGP